MSDAAAVLLALSTACGVPLARPVPRWWGLALIGVALLARRPFVLCAGAAFLASALASSAWAGVRPPAPRAVDETVTLLRDPSLKGGAMRAEVRLGRMHVEVAARGAAGHVLGERLAGERFQVRGDLHAAPLSVRAYLARQHVAAVLDADEVTDPRPGDPASRVANGLRRTLVRVPILPPEQRTLFTGFLLGDDRGQAIETVDDFRSSGLSHLLVVSGGNVAFALALAGPLLRRLPITSRLLAGLAVLGLFGVLTRWEPSVLRAVAMAGISMVAVAWGRPVSSLRLLALAVATLLLVDPLLVGSVGFLLSVGACTGIALFAEPLSDVLPGPRVLASAAGVTLAAQAGVAPVLLPAFGAMPVATLPANLLAMPAAGPVLMWGMLAGIPAGLLGGWPAAVLHLPTRLFVGWIALVARSTARAPLGRLGATGLLLIVSCVAVAVLVRRLRTFALAGAVAALAAPAIALAVTRPPPAGGQEVVAGARLWRHDATAVLVVDRPRADRLLAWLRGAGVRRIDVLVLEGKGSEAAHAVDPVRRRIAVDTTVGPDLPTGSTIRAGPFVITVVAPAPDFEVQVEWAEAGG